MDEAFLSVGAIVERILALPGEVVDETEGVRSYVTACEIDSPIELDVSRDEEGKLLVGSVPPLYYVDTSVQPSYHRLRLTIAITGDRNGG